MQYQKCAKGHVYDSDKYSACPVCNSGTSIISFGESSNEGHTIAPSIQEEMDQFGHTSAEAPSSGRTVAEINPGKAFSVESKTVSPEMARPDRTVGAFEKQNSYDPVVGWLVCIDGPEKGRDFRILARINTIGRSKRMDICIEKDNTITQENHARLAYDPKHNKFRIYPDNNINNIYINDEPIYGATLLNRFDLIEIGSYKLLFVPLCCDTFTWENGLKQEN